MTSENLTSENLARPATITDELLDRITARVVSSGGGEWKLTEVYTGEVITTLPQSSPKDIETAFARAREAQRTWSQWPVKKRLGVFKKFHKLLLENNTTIVDLIQAESGKARRMAFDETCDPAMVTSHYLKRAAKLLAPTKRGGPVPVISTSTEIRQPKGVVGIIAPWNFPFATGLSDAIPALMAGNGVVLKPDNKTALSPLFGISLLYEAGLPEGLFQVVCGEGPDVGPTLIDNANYVMFTGSTATGRFIGQRAGENLIGACLELGGKNPMIVLPDANLDEVVEGALFGVFGNTGQICMHIERMYIHDSIYDDFKERFVTATKALKIGAAYDFEPELGSLISVDHKDRVASHVADAIEKGATVVTGGRERPDLGPAFYEPTILEGVTADMLTGLVRDLRPRGGAAPLLVGGRGRGAGQRHGVRPERQHLGHRPRQGDGGGRADRGRQRERQRRAGSGVRLQGHAVRRRQAVRRGCAARRPGAAQVHRRDQPVGAQEAGPLGSSRRALREACRADAQGAGDDAAVGDPLTACC